MSSALSVATGFVSLALALVFLTGGVAAFGFPEEATVAAVSFSTEAGASAGLAAVGSVAFLGVGVVVSAFAGDGFSTFGISAVTALAVAFFSLDAAGTTGLVLDALVAFG